MCNHNKHFEFDSDCEDCLDWLFDDSEPIKIDITFVNIHGMVTDCKMESGLVFGQSLEEVLSSGKFLSYSINQ